MTTPLYPYRERAKLTSEALMAFKRLLPKLTEKHQIRKVKSDIVRHERWLRECG